MKLAFVIAAYNEELLVAECLRSVLAEVERTGRSADVDVVVVDNASTDRTAEIARGFAGVRVVHEPEKGIVHARDAGFRATDAELVANIDADTIVPPGWLDTVFKDFSADPQLVALSGPYHYHDLSRPKQWVVAGFYAVTWLAYLLNRFVLRVGSVVQGGNFVFRRAAWEQVGGYDRSIAFFGEDTDVAVRLSRVGKVRWTYKLKMLTSGRRMENEGLVRTGARYVINFLSVTFRGRPATVDYEDVRPDAPGR
jgi:glycosyltransferase involved in cell wall biosynthesis